MAKKKSLFQEFTKGILVENPVLRLVLGTCPTLAVSTSVCAESSAIFGAVTLFVTARRVVATRHIRKSATVGMANSLKFFMPSQPLSSFFP